MLSWAPPQQLGAILKSCLNANVSAPSGLLSSWNGLLIFGIVCLVTLLIFLHSLHLNALLNVSISVISSTLHRFLRAGIVSSSYVFIFILFFLFFLGRLLVLYFSLVAPAICYLFFLHVVLYVFLSNKWWWLWWCYGWLVLQHALDVQEYRQVTMAETIFAMTPKCSK